MTAPARFVDAGAAPRFHVAGARWTGDGKDDCPAEDVIIGENPCGSDVWTPARACEPVDHAATPLASSGTCEVYPPCVE